MAVSGWKRVEGAELEDTIVRGEPLDGVLSDVQAVYLWRRSLYPPRGIADSPKRVEEWIESALSVPFGKITDKSLSHYANLDSLTLGGGHLSGEKKEQLRKLLSDPSRRRWTIGFIRGLNEFVPALYVGETRNLQRRTKEHIKGETDFAKGLSNRLGLDWVDVHLRYLPLGEAVEDLEDTSRARERRQLLEMVVTKLAIGGLVNRPG